MANLGRQIANNNGSQLASLRAVKHVVDSTVLKSDLSSPKEKSLSDDILTKLADKLSLSEESLGTYLLDLNSATIDAILARIVDVVTKNSGSSFSDEQLESLKETLEVVLSTKAADKTVDKTSKQLKTVTEVLARLDKSFQDQVSKQDKDKTLSDISSQISKIATSAEQILAAENSEAERSKTSEQNQLTLAQIQDLFREAQDSKDDKVDNAGSIDGESISQSLADLSETIKTGIAAKSGDTAVAVPVEKSGNYNSTTPAANFSTLQQYIDLQFQSLNNIESQIQAAASIVIPEAISVKDISMMLKTEFENTMLPEIEKTITNIQSAVQQNSGEMSDPIKALEEKLDEVQNAIVDNIETNTNKILDTLGTSIKEQKSAMKSADLDDVNKNMSAAFENLNCKFDDAEVKQEKRFTSIGGLISHGILAAATAPLKLVGSLFSALNPFKKKKKKKTPEEMKMAQMIDKVNNFIDNFIDMMVEKVDVFLAKAFKSAKKYVNELMLQVFGWIVANVGFIAGVLAIVLPLIAEPLEKILEPFMKFMTNLVNGVKAVVLSVIDFLKPVRDFIIDTLSAVWRIIEPPLKAFFEGLASCAKAVAIGLGTFVTSVLNVLALLMKGIASGAERLGKALVTFATAVVDVLACFMRGLASQAEAIGRGLGKFITEVLNVLTLFMQGLGERAKEIGEAFGSVVIALLECVEVLVRLIKEAGEMMIDIARIIHAPIKFLADLLDGIGTRAKQIGEMIGVTIYNFFKGFATKAEEIGKKVGDVMILVLDIILAVLRPLKAGLDNLTKLVRIYVIAPLKGIQRKITGLKVKLARNFSFEVPVMSFNGSWKPWEWSMGWRTFYPFAFLTGGMSEKMQMEALKDADSSVSDLINDEMNKMKEQIKAEEEAEKQKALADQVERKKIADLVNNVKDIKDIKDLLNGTIMTKLDSIIKNMKVLFDEFSLTFEEKDTTAPITSAVKNAFDGFKGLFKSFQAPKPEAQTTNATALQINGANKKALADILKPQSSEELDKTAAAQTSNASEGKMPKFTKQIMAYLTQMSSTMSTNFAAILEKLDDKPNLLPMPIMSSANVNNLATMENN